MKIILDACNNHLGNRDLITQMINIANGYGIDYIKFQLYDSEDLNTLYPDYENYKGDLNKCQIDYGLFEYIMEYTEFLDIKPMFTIFNLERLKWFEDYLEYEFGFKIASPNGMDKQFIKTVYEVAEELEMPIVISHGMNTVSQAMDIQKTFPYAVHMYCISKYPTVKEDVDWMYMKKFDGFSDHENGTTIARLVGNRYQGIKLDWYEKHFTLSKFLPGKDHEISITPQELELFKRDLNYSDNIEQYINRWVEGEN